MIYTGLIWQSVFSYGLQLEFIAASIARLQNISLNCVFQWNLNHQDINSRRSSQSNLLSVAPVKLSTYGPRSFAVAGPTIWNTLPEYLRDPELSMDNNFRRQLKTFLFAQYWRGHTSALETLVLVRPINILFTSVLGSEIAVLWQDRSQIGLGLSLGLILLVLLPTLLCSTRCCVTR